MSMNANKSLLWLGCAVFGSLAIWGVFSALSGGGSSVETDEDGQSRRGYIKSVASKGRSADGKTGRGFVRKDRQFKHVKIKLDEKLKPELQLDDEEEARLSDFCKKVLKDVQKALDREDLKMLVVVLEKIKVKMVEARAKGIDVNSVVPELVRIRAIEACGWFGKEALPEILDGMTDESPQVRTMSAEEFQSTLDDAAFGDYDRAELVKAAAKVIDDPDALDSIFMSINDMRNSVVADTVIDIMKNGTDQAKSLMEEQLEFFTESDVKTEEDVAKWLEENPDDEDADEFYAPLET